MRQQIAVCDWCGRKDVQDQPNRLPTSQWLELGMHGGLRDGEHYDVCPDCDAKLDAFIKRASDPSGDCGKPMPSKPGDGFEILCCHEHGHDGKHSWEVTP